MSTDNHSLLNYDRVKSDPVSARLYANRRQAKHDAELKLLSRAFGLFPSHPQCKVLDAPCGVGRLCIWLGRQGYRVTGVDLGEAAVALARDALGSAGIQAEIQLQDVFALTFSDRAFDLTLCFRLLHHFENPQTKAALIAELCRVTSRYVLISYFSPCSVTSLKRKLLYRLTGKPVKQYPDTLPWLQQCFGDVGFRLVGRVERSPWLHSLQLAVFERTDTAVSGHRPQPGE